MWKPSIHAERKLSAFPSVKAKCGDTTADRQNYKWDRLQ